MISAGVEGRLPYMTYSEPWSRNPPKQPPEVFLRPAPKLLPSPARCTTQEPPPIFLSSRNYNGVTTTTYPNGTRIAPSRPISKYASPPPSAIPVNLTQPKEERGDPISPFSAYGIYSPQYSSFPYPTLCGQPYMLRAFPPTPVSPQEIFSPGTPTASSTATFLSPTSTFSPPTTLVKTNQTIVRDKRTPPGTPATPTSIPHSPLPQSPSFKVPSGKEGSLKHRILIRPEDAIRNAPLDLQKPPEGRKRLAASISPPQSPKKSLNNNTVPANFNRGQLIQLANGEYKKIEDMRTEDFIQSAEKSPALRLAESTVVKIEEGREGHITITLTYDHRRAQVEVDSTPEHPYFVIGHGWASCNPDRTIKYYGLKVHRLQVGDVLVSLTPREPPSSTVTSNSSRGTTIMTTATTTTMSARPYPVNVASSTITTSTSNNINHFNPPPNSPKFSKSSHFNHTNHRPLSHSPPKPVRSPEYILPTTQPMSYYCTSTNDAQTTPLQLDAESRKRRWSAPDAIEEDETTIQRSRVE